MNLWNLTTTKNLVSFFGRDMRPTCPRDQMVSSKVQQSFRQQKSTPHPQAARDDRGRASLPGNFFRCAQIGLTQRAGTSRSTGGSHFKNLKSKIQNPKSKIQNPKSKIQNPFPATTRRYSSAFSLIEVLVATAVLALILVLITQVVDGIMQSIQVQNRQLDSASSARRALDVIEADLRTAVISPDASILISGTAQPPLAFLSRRRGPDGAPNHRLLAISYSLNEDGELRRGYRSVRFDDTDLLAAALTDPPENQVSVLSKGILAWSVRVVAGGEKKSLGATPAADEDWATATYNGLTVPSGYQALIAAGPAFANGLKNRATALEIWIAAVDPTAERILQDSGTLSAARTALGSDPAAWRQALDTSSLPPPVKSSARVLNKTIPLP